MSRCPIRPFGRATNGASFHFWALCLFGPRVRRPGAGTPATLAPSGRYELLGILRTTRDQMDRPGGAVWACVWTRLGDRPSHGFDQ